ncbi:MAG: hypothetical protein ABI618_15665 [Nitrospirota bacterium]
MKTSQVLTVVCLAGGLVTFSGFPAEAQHSSGGTAPGVTENQGQGGSQPTQGVPGSGWNAQQGGGGSGSGRASGTASGEANSPESSKGTGYGLESGSHSEKDIGSGGHMGSGGGSGSGGNMQSSGGSGSSGSGRGGGK